MKKQNESKIMQIIQLKNEEDSNQISEKEELIKIKAEIYKIGQIIM